ncbi:neurofilament heavy polypeptide-like [Salvia divinorum]|uniref:Neurofilament heavy polypeptide-like n=1 Tax=Salvia divinorum TaxID=28513 RepID=A0ABD1H8Y0_SALDI
MVGGGNRRDEGSFTVSNTNVFAALETLRKKKKSDKDKGSKSTGAASGKSKKEEEKPVYWAPAPLTVKSWADVDDEDDDDYYATTAPPQAMWGGSGVGKVDETEKQDHLEESESEDELLDEGDDDVEEEPEHEMEVGEPSEPIVETQVEQSPAPRETERQLSKKERRKKELAELEAILADFGVNPKEKAEDETNDVNKDGKEVQLNGVEEKKDSAAPAESKSAKKKKKKDKASKEAKEPQDQPNTSDAPKEQDETEQVEGDSSAVDVKERLKKVASAKKKKSNKEVDSAARAVAMEAAARSAKLAAAKKKEKNHYNQQPIR